MAREVKRRRYTSAARKAQAAATRRSILDAAHALFVADGYAATTIQAIADDAGVAVQTVYAVFGNKRRLDQVIEAAIVGDDDPDARDGPARGPGVRRGVRPAPMCPDVGRCTAAASANALHRSSASPGRRPQSDPGYATVYDADAGTPPKGDDRRRQDARRPGEAANKDAKTRRRRCTCSTAPTSPTC